MESVRRQAVALATVALAVTTAAGCGSSGGSASGPGKTLTVGLLTDATGPAASGNKSSVEGVKAGAVYAARNGYTVKYIVADTQSSPTATAAAAQKLVTQDHVDVVIAHSALTSLASNYLTARGIPVVGPGEDGPEWTTAKNMFSVFGALHTTKVATTPGDFFKLLGVTNVGTLGYSVSPISAESAKSTAKSAEHAGLKVGYLNSNFPFGSTNVAPVALDMKSAGVNGFTSSTDPNTAYALIAALRDQGVALKAAVLATGYGNDVLQAGKGALQAAQNVYFGLAYEPVEMHTTATKQLAADMKAVGVSGSPTFAEYNAYVSVGLIVQALKANGSDTSHAGLIKALSNIHDFTALGLFGSHKLDINDRNNIVLGVDNCQWYTKLEGDKFVLVKGATPLCGTTVPGETVSPSS